MMSWNRLSRKVSWTDPESDVLVCIRWQDVVSRVNTSVIMVRVR